MLLDPRSTRTSSFLCAMAFVWVTAGTASRTAHAVDLPPSFQESIVFSGLNLPTAVRFSPDGRVFVAEKRGVIKVFDDLNDTTATVFADLSVQVYDFWDRGLLGLALDPDFPANPYVYVLYTRDATIGGVAPIWSDGCPSPPGPTGDGCIASGRLSRLEAVGNTWTGVEHVLIDDWCQQYPSHSVGDIHFGLDGALYVTAGDGASFNFVDHGQDGSPVNPCGDPLLQGGALRSQDIRTTGDPVTLDGTLLRVDPATGLALPDNPLFGGPESGDDRIIAYGLRNPFRCTVHPFTNEIWIGDVGWNVWEEINRIPDPLDAVVENFGWPCYEGSPRQPGYDAANYPICETLYATPGAVTSPYYAYNHSSAIASGSCTTGTSAISGLAFYVGGNYPAAYTDALFFADYSRNCISVMFAGPGGLPDPTNRATFAGQCSAPVDLRIGPGGDLFYVDIGGTIRRIRYFTSNQPPVAILDASPTSGTAPLTVQLNATNSFDADPGDTITFAWDLDDDGAFDDSTLPQLMHTLTLPGSYPLRLRVTDNLGASAVASVTISVDNSPPMLNVLSPLPGDTWRVGDSIAFAAQAVDPETGPLPDSALSWSVVLLHCHHHDPGDCHEHFLQDFQGVASGQFTAPITVIRRSSSSVSRRPTAS